MSGLTKEQLKNELITHGVELPPSSAKKSEYVELYDKYVLPIVQSKGEFSSDDDEESTSTPSITPQASTNMVVDGVDVESLNDEELFTRLQALGATCGPIVASTRKIYQKKLIGLMGGDVTDAAPQYNGDVDLDEDEEEYSDKEEPEEEPIEPRKTRLSAGTDVTGSSTSKTTTTTTTYTSKYSSSGSPEVRRRVAETLAASPTSTSMTFDPDRHTPSPRRSLRTVTGSTSETITVRKTVNNGSSAKLVTSEQTSPELKEEVVIEESGSKLGALCRILVKLVLLALLIIVLLYIYQLYQENSPDDPIKALEELAKQALEAATGQEVEAGDGPVPPAAVPPAAAPPAAAPPAAAPPAVAPPAAPPAVPTQ